MSSDNINEYDIGDRPTLQGSFTDSAGAAADPTTVVCKVKDPDGAESTPAVSNPSVGTYTAQFTVSKQGRHYYRFEGTGTVVAAGEHKFDVRPSEFV